MITGNKLTVLEVVVFFLAALFFAKYFNITIGSYDFLQHAIIADKIYKTGDLFSPHFAYHLLLLFLKVVINLDLRTASLIIVVCSKMLTLLVVYYYLTREAGRSVQALFITLSLAVVGPVSVLAYTDYQLFFGYLNSHTYHNPTYELLKPFALMTFILICQRIENYKSLASTIALLVLTPLVCFIKPSFTMIILPAVACYLLYSFVKWKKIDSLLLYFILTSGLVLLWQLFVYYQFGGDHNVRLKGGIVIEPFVVMGLHSDFLVVKFFLSILFVIVLIAAFPDVLKKNTYLFTLLIFAVSCVFAYLFAESGPHMRDGNFVWCAYVGVFLLFVHSGKIAYENIAKMGVLQLKPIFIQFVLLMHVVGGLYWVYYGRYFNFYQYLNWKAVISGNVKSLL